MNKKIRSFLLALILLFAVEVVGDQQNSQQRIEELSQKVDQTTNMSDLMSMQKELMDISKEMLKGMQGMQGMEGMPVSLQKGKTPAEEIERAMQAVNFAYKNISSNLGLINDESMQPIPVSYATKLTGSISLKGKDIPPSKDWQRLNLHYDVSEKFVGYLMVTKYYNPQKKQFNDQKDYFIASISTGVNVVSFSGKECVELSSSLPVSCRMWEQYTQYELDDNDVYPAMHSWVIQGSTEEGQLTIEVESPTILFHSASKRANRSTGCFGVEYDVPSVNFASEIEDGKYQQNRQIGRKFQGSPHCSDGSELTFKFDVCDAEIYLKNDKCQQIKSLVEAATLAAQLSKLYGEYANEAESLEDLTASVNLELQDIYPDIDLESDAFLEKHAGGFNICSGEMHIPDYCSGCMPSPLCQWNHDAVKVHEKVHKEDINHGDIKKLFCDTNYQMSTYPNANERDKVMAQAWGKLDSDAYAEQARYLLGIISQQMSQSACKFDAQIYSDIEDVEKTVN